MATLPPNIQISENPVQGRALTSTTDLAPGTPILTLPPLLLLPSQPYLTALCTHCLATQPTPRACTRCRSSYYCSPACQKANWSAIHAKECKPLGRIKDQEKGNVPTPVRLLMQILLKDEVGAKMEALEGHESVWKEREEWRDLEVMSMGAVTFAGKGEGEDDVKKACEIMCKVQTNAFNWSDPDLGQAGIFIEPTLAMMNHSCTPNAMVQVVGRNVVVRAEKEIKAGDNIEISYTDYTWPKPERQEALKTYNFECQCLRCQGDLNVYQACAIYPNIELNRYGVAPELIDIRQHPASKPKQASVNAMSETAAVEIRELTPPHEEKSRHIALQKRYQCCEDLVKQNLWAVTPLPQVVTDISANYAEQGDWAYALAVACLIATSCDSYRFPATFHPVRVKGLLVIAKLLSNTAADTASVGESKNSLAAKAGLGTKLQETLRETDQLALCQMLLIMVIRMAPAGPGKEWQPIKEAQEMLDDIRQLPGRENELSLIHAWAKDLEDEQSQSFFKYAVVDPVHILAELGKEVLEADFGDS